MKTFAEWVKERPVNEDGFLRNLFNTGMGRPAQQPQQQLRPPVATPVASPGAQQIPVAQRLQTANVTAANVIPPQPGIPVAQRLQGTQVPPPNQPTLARRANPASPAQSAQPATAPQPGVTPQPQPATASRPAMASPATQQPSATGQSAAPVVDPKNPFGAAPFQKQPTPADGSKWTDWLKKNNLPDDFQTGQPTNMRDRAKQGLSYRATPGMGQAYLDSVARSFKNQKPPAAGQSTQQPGA